MEKIQPAVGQIWTWHPGGSDYKNVELISRHTTYIDNLGWDFKDKKGGGGWFADAEFKGADFEFIGWAPGYGPQPPVEEKSPSFEQLKALKLKHEDLIRGIRDLIKKYE